MMDLVVILVWVAIGQVVPMLVGEVLMVALEVNLVVMEDMLVPWGLIEVILLLGMLVDMVEALAEATILVGTVELMRVMGHMAVVVVGPLVMLMEAAMMAALGVDMEELVEAPFMGLEGDMVVQELLDIILMEDRSLSSQKYSLGLICLVSKQVCSLL